MPFANKLLPAPTDSSPKVPASSLRPGEGFYTCLGKIRTIHMKADDHFIERDEDKFLRKIEKGSYGYDRLVVKVKKS
jgi:hypothetical protein